MEGQHLKEYERLDSFIREKLVIIQSERFFTFSLDAVLLADFVSFPKRNVRYLDFCTGNGVIPLLLSHKTSSVLRGIDIQEDLIDMAQRSARLNKLEEQLQFEVADIRTFRNDGAQYDMITCNPPYFVCENTREQHRLSSHAIARHEITLTLNDWIYRASKLLKDKGKLYFVHRPERLDVITATLLEHGFSIHRLKFIYPKKGQRANMMLVEAIYRGGQQGVKIEPPLVVHTDDNQYTKEVQTIYYGE